MEKLKKFSEGFFKNLKCEIHWELQSDDGEPCVIENGEDVGAILVVKNVPKSFEDLFGKKAPYRISFISTDDCDFIGKGSLLLMTIMKFLKGTGKTTLLKIDFDCEPESEINNAISFKNCEISNVVKRHKNNFFSRFTFITTFNYINKTERFVNEIYVHDGKIVNGNLNGYSVLEGRNGEASVHHLETDYCIARNALRDLLKSESGKLGNVLEKKLEMEIKRIQKHYENLLGELGGDLSETIKKVRETELSLRTTDKSEAKLIRKKLDRLKKGLVKIGDDDSRNRILKEQEFTIKDVMQKYSLNIDNKLVNTTVIYYPVFSFDLFLKSDVSGRLIRMTYDPLTKTLNKLNCESCGKEITQLNLCSAGHINCDNCLEKCGECGKLFCKKCLKKSCFLCGKKSCDNCSIMCLGCGKYVCRDHIRKDCVSGEERCASCLRACLRCHGLAAEKYFGKAKDGSKVCQKCLGNENREEVLSRIFGK